MPVVLCRSHLYTGILGDWLMTHLNWGSQWGWLSQDYPMFSTICYRDQQLLQFMTQGCWRTNCVVTDWHSIWRWWMFTLNCVTKLSCCVSIPLWHRRSRLWPPQTPLAIQLPKEPDIWCWVVQWNSTLPQPLSIAVTRNLWGPGCTLVTARTSMDSHLVLY